MKRRAFIAGLGAAASVWPYRVQAQRHDRWRIAQVRAGRPEVIGRSATALEDRLKELGYVHGRNIELTNRFVSPEPTAMERAIQELLPQIDLLVTWGTVGGAIAKKLVSNLPVVFVSVGAPIEIGLVSSLAQPGGNMTGITFEAATETYAKRLQLLKELAPNLTRVAILHAHGDPNVPFAMASLQKSSPAMGVEIAPIGIGSGGELGEAFAAMQRMNAGGFVSVAGNLTAVNGKTIADLALQYRLPACHAFNETVAAGGLMSLGPDRVWMATRAADYVEKIIRGSHPRTLPVQQPERYEFHLNLKTARALGLIVPPTLLARADEVIE
jgi:putative ABC transport system substrate-binding protein